MININSSLGSVLSGLNNPPSSLQGKNGVSRADQQIPQATGHADRASDLTRFNAPKAAALLNEKMSSSVRSALGTNASSPPAGQGGDFSPENVAKNILSFIDSAIAFARAKGDEPAAIAQKMAEGKAAVEQGFAEARDILQSFGAWNGAVKENAEKTLDLIHQGFDDRAALPPADAVTGTQSTNLAALNTKRTETFQMEITTREGDIVKLSYSANQSAGFSASRIADEGGVKQAISAYSSKSENLSFSVQGNLNADEQKAIANLMKDVDKLAKDFYGGDMQGAMQHAMSLNMNKEQLSSLSLELRYTESRSAISSYQQVGALDPHQRGPAPLSNDETRTIGNFNKDLEAMLREADRFFQRTEEIVKTLFRDIGSMTSDKPEDSARAALKEILENMVGAAAGRNEQTKAVSSPEI